MTTVYIAGPMRGIPYYNFPAFDAARDRLEAQGYIVISPADMDREIGFDPHCNTYPDHFDWSQVPNFDFSACRKRDINAIESCDAIYMLNGWENSKGAKAEKAYAEWIGKEIMYQLQSNAADKQPAATCPRHDRVFPDDAKKRKEYPLFRGLLKYFPDALAAVAHVSFIGNEQHHPGTPLHWDKAKSTDEEDAMIRHLIDGEYPAMAWRALAALQRKIDSQKQEAK